MSLSWQTILAIGFGVFGAIARAYAVHFTNKHIPLEFPFRNFIGKSYWFIYNRCFICLFSHYTVSINTKAFLTTGF